MKELHGWYKRIEKIYRYIYIVQVTGRAQKLPLYDYVTLWDTGMDFTPHDSLVLGIGYEQYTPTENDLQKAIKAVWL